MLELPNLCPFTTIQILQVLLCNVEELGLYISALEHARIIIFTVMFFYHP